jgi:hypothetical protein
MLTRMRRDQRTIAAVALRCRLAWWIAVALVVPGVILSAPPLFSALRLAAAIRGLPWPNRRAIVLGHYVSAIEQITLAIPPNAAVAIVPASAADRDVAIFSVYDFFPRPARVYGTTAAWRANDDGGARRAARPDWIVVVDEARHHRLILCRVESGRVAQVLVR